MYKILTYDKISPSGLDEFDRNLYSIGSEIENPDAILVRSSSMHEMAFSENLLAIARAGAGTNNIPSEKCANDGIVVFNTPGANANAVKELVILGLLVSSRKVVGSLDWVKTLKGEGENVPKLVEKGKGKFAGPEILGKKLGIIGLGAIGVLVANAAVALGMKVYGYDPYISVDAAWGLSGEVVHAKSLKEIYENCDYITVHVPFTKETKGMINSSSISSMKAGVRILNFSRAELVENADILDAIEDGKVACYVIDFPTEELIDKKGVIAIPHLGASTPESEDNCAKMAALEIIDYVQNGNIVNSVNLPNASLPRSTDLRITVIHKNVSGVISQITTIISESGANIENLVNKSKGDLAYTILDADSEVSENAIEKIKAIDGIIKVRVI